MTISPFYLNFNGTPIISSVEIPITPELLTNQLTFEAIIQTTDLNRAIAARAPLLTNTNPDILVRVFSGRISVFVVFTNFNFINLHSNQLVADGDLHHIAVTYDQSELRIYIDGMLDNSVPENRTMLTDGQKIYIGRNYEGVGVAGFTGRISNVRIYNRALSASEVLQNFNDISPVTDGLSGQWLMNEGYGDVINDTSGNNNHGARLSDAIWSIQSGYQTISLPLQQKISINGQIILNLVQTLIKTITLQLNQKIFLKGDVILPLTIIIDDSEKTIIFGKINLIGEVGETAKNQNFCMVAGDTKMLIISINEITNFDNVSIKWGARKDYFTRNNLIFKELNNGIKINDETIQITLNPLDTDNLRGTLYHELEITDELNNITTVLVGTMKIIHSGVE